MTHDQFVAELRSEAKSLDRYGDIRAAELMREAADRLDAYKAVGVALMREQSPPRGG